MCGMFSVCRPTSTCALNDPQALGLVEELLRKRVLCRRLSGGGSSWRVLSTPSGRGAKTQGLLSARAAHLGSYTAAVKIYFSEEAVKVDVAHVFHEGTELALARDHRAPVTVSIEQPFERGLAQTLGESSSPASPQPFPPQ